MSAPEFPKGIVPSTLKNCLKPLSLWASKSSAEADLESIFGSHMDWASAFNYIAAFRRVDFSLLPVIRTLPATDMPGLWGGYSRDTREIYLSADCPQELLSAVIIEEIGHFLDQELCSEETPGEEGAHFAAVVLGLALDAASSDDSLAPLSFQGRELLVEAAPKLRGSSKAKSSGSSGKSSGSGSAAVGSSSSNPKLQENIIYATRDSVRLVQKAPGDRLIGSRGDDTFAVLSQDVIIEDPNGGTDTVESSVTFSLASYATMEKLALTGGANINATGNLKANVITGNSGNNVLDGGVGVDTLVGGAGDDTYIVNDINDLVLEKISAGKDWIFTSDSKVHEAFLSGKYANVEEIKFTGPPPLPKPGDPSDKDDRLVGTPEFDEIDGGKGNDTISGLSENDRLIGSEGDDSLDGGEGDDKLSGGAGNDTILVDSAKDVVIENSNKGVDTIVSKITYSLATLQNVENIVLFGASNSEGTSDDAPTIDANLNATGNAARNSLFGNSGKNSLNGAEGADSLIGGDGSDTLNGGASDGVADYLSGGNGDDVFILDSALDSLDGGSGRDAVLSSLSFSLLSQAVQGVENLVYTGQSSASLRGNQFDNSLVGSEGNQSLFGDAGEDTLSGYAGKDWLDAGLGNDFLDGGSGSDTMIGGEGDDTYAFRDLGDNVSEGPRGSGNDVLHAYISATLSAGIETLLLVGSEPINGTGNNAANILTGNSENNLIVGLGGADTLDGGGGANILDGGAGDDYYIIYGTADTILESSGTDTIETRGDNFDLRNKSYFKKIENIVLAGAARTAIGNDNDNVIKAKNASDTLGYALFGGLGNDSLLGAQGRDLLEGNEGDDTLLSGGLADSVGNTLRGGAGKDSLFAGDGNDLLFGGSSASFGFSDADVDEANNMDTLVGGDGNDTLDGGLGADSMLGGEGNDIYTLDNKADRIVEKRNEGTDAVVSSLSIDFSSFNASIENATLLGSQNLFLTANDSNNLVAGNKGSNRISGLNGNDTLLGGDGRDTLLGGEDSDSLDGGLGADSLAGGNGDDTYLVDAGGDQVIEKAGFDTGIDHVFSAVNFDPVSPWLVEFGFGPDLDDGSPSITKQKSFASIDRFSFQNLENFTFIESAVRGIGNAENNFFTGNERDNIILAQGGDDTITGGLGDDSLYGESDGLYATRADLESLNPRPNPDFSALVKFLEDEITGGALGVGRDSLVGGEGNDYLDAGALNDTMVGGTGDDTMVVDNEEDDLREVAGEGDDWVRASVNVNLLGENIENLFLRIEPQTIWQKANAGGASIGQKAQEAPANLGTGNAGSNLVVASYSTDDPFTSEDETITQFPETPVQFIPGRRVNGTSFALDWEAPDSLSNSVPYTQYIVQFRRSGTSQWITFDEQVDKTANDINVTGLTSGLRYDFQVLATGFTTLRGLNGSDTILGGDYSLEIRQLGDADETITLYTVDGASFRESLVGGNGNDYLDGGLGIDTLEGGFGNDTLVVDDLADAMREFGAENGTTDGAQKLFGRDLVLSRINLDLDDQIVDLGKFIEDLTAVEGAGELVLRGNRLDNFIAGNDQANSLFGERGNDTIAGGHANDQIFGDDGNDLLVGAVYSGLSVDTFKTQIDTLTGGNGNDIFRLLNEEGKRHYLVSDSADYALITDFEPGKDRIERGSGDFLFGLPLPPGVSNGLTIYFDPVGLPPDLIAVVQSRDGSTLTLNTPGI